MFSTNYLASGKPPSVWDAVNQLQSQVNSLNATVIEQQALISELQTQVDILNATKLGTPDYDSGWIYTYENHIVLFHNLGTNETLVYLIGKAFPWEGIHGYWVSLYNLSWWNLNATHITVTGMSESRFVRVMIWKIPEP
jgi:hypothetical protein